MATDYLLQEDGVGKIILEDASGNVILESSTPGVTYPQLERGIRGLNRGLVLGAA